jgi:hypothetical protein
MYVGQRRCGAGTFQAFVKNRPFVRNSLHFHKAPTFVRLISTKTAESSALEIFEALFTDDIVDSILLKTNRYVTQQQAKCPTAFKRWQELKTSEFWQFLS